MGGCSAGACVSSERRSLPCPGSIVLRHALQRSRPAPKRALNRHMGAINVVSGAIGRNVLPHVPGFPNHGMCPQQARAQRPTEPVAVVEIRMAHKTCLPGWFVFQGSACVLPEAARHGPLSSCHAELQSYPDVRPACPSCRCTFVVIFPSAFHVYVGPFRASAGSVSLSLMYVRVVLFATSA